MKRKQRAKKGCKHCPKHCPKGKIRLVYYDWKDIESAGEEFVSALKAFGLYVYKSPVCAGSDSFGWVISDELLTRAEVRGLEGL